MGVRLDNVIADQRYVLECLELLRKIQESGNCHTCDNQKCDCKPEWGEMIRYNCPYYKNYNEKLSNPIKVEAVTRGNCMICGKELTEGLFICKECEDKARCRK